MYKKSFIFLRKNKLSEKLINLIQLFKLFHNSKENLNSFLPYLFCKIFMQVHFLLKRKKQSLNLYLKLVDQMQLEVQELIRVSKNFGFKKRLEKSQLYLKTENYYGMLFENFSKYNYYQEPYQLLTTRLKKNKFKINFFKNKSILDYGCGNGRYTQALARLATTYSKKKAPTILGFDKSKKNIQVAKKKNKFKNVLYKCGDVNKNSLKSESFDIIFCNGVLHHTGNILSGLRQIHRILKKEGICIIYLSSTDGIKWYFIEAFREILKKCDVSSFFSTLKKLNLVDSKIFYLMDHVFVKYNHLTTINEVQKLFKSAKLKMVKKFERGHPIDDIERLQKLKRKVKSKLVFDIYGYGEHRYVLSKS
jgi:2-polyprenyl-3-methyl-5-hydroxy-6-metoxy-1,4-benzoquinol methylase